MESELDSLLNPESSSDFINSIINDKDTEENTSITLSEDEEEDCKDIQQIVFNKANDMLDKTKDAVEEVLMCVSQEPTNGEVISAASSLIKSYTGLLGELSKINTLNEKFKQRKELQRERIVATQNINQSNNEARVLMKREEIIAAIKASEPILDVGVQEDNNEITVNNVDEI